jgi:hypothetical protein
MKDGVYRVNAPGQAWESPACHALPPGLRVTKLGLSLVRGYAMRAVPGEPMLSCEVATEVDAWERVAIPDALLAGRAAILAEHKKEIEQVEVVPLNRYVYVLTTEEPNEVALRNEPDL